MRMLNVGIIALVVVASPLLVQQHVQAEKYMGIGYNYSINDVKAIFPGATFEDQKVAWAKPGEKLIRITGIGITGSILILFRDARPSYAEVYKPYWTTFVKGMVKRRRESADQPKLTPEVEKVAEESAARQAQKWAEEFAASQSDDKGYLAKWVRWSPNAPIPLSRLKTKFGEKVRYVIDDQDFSTWVAWDSKGVAASLTDDKKSVRWVQFEFTQTEQREGMEKSASRIIDSITGSSQAFEYFANPSLQYNVEPSPAEGESNPLSNGGALDKAMERWNSDQWRENANE